ncbi:MAG: hypothetical protein NC127_02105 [Muribaculum sp.]|nr:hypothetical protein [Muribaculum sp.]
MSIIRQATAYTLGFCFAAIGQAQEPLSKEITVEKEIIPQEREASRLFQQPELILPSIKQKKLNWSDRAVIAPVTPSITVLPPNRYASSVTPPDTRGYVDVGYFPSFQLGASAGYKLIDNEYTRLGAWLQYDGSQYSKENVYGLKPTYKSHDFTLGADLNHTFDGIGTLSADFAYGFNALWFPVFGYGNSGNVVVDEAFNRTANRAGIGLKWTSQLGRLDLHAGVSYGYFGFSKAYPGTDLKALTDGSFSISAGASYPLGKSSAVGADLSYSSTSFSESLGIFLGKNNEFEGICSPSVSFGVVDFAPYFILHGANYSARLGVELTAQTGEVSGVNIGPDVRLDWMPSQQFAVYAQVKAAHVTLNTLGSMLDRDRYINPSIVYLPTRTKGQFDLGIVIGPFAGASFEAWGGVGSYDYANMPILYHNQYSSANPATYINTLGMYAPMSFKSFNYGIAFNYSYGDLLQLRFSYEGAPQEHDCGYIEWADRAKSVITASLTVTPVKPLDITVAYRRRSHRAVMSILTEQAEIFKGYVYSMTPLGDINSLDLSASYRFNERFSVWANVENLLGEKWQLTYGVPNVGVTGLVGIGYKF